MQKFYDKKIEGRLDAIEEMLYEQIRTNCDTLANIHLIRYLQTFKELDAEKRAKLELPLE